MSIIREIQTAKVLILGCGNTLLGDDGFGPAVIDELRNNYNLPENVIAEDVGTSIREVLFDIALSEKQPAHIVLIDTIGKEDRDHGEVFEVDLADLTEKKRADYSLHQFPTSNLLKEIQEFCRIKVTVIAANLPGEPERLTMALSDAMKGAVAVAARKAHELASKD